MNLLRWLFPKMVPLREHKRIVRTLTEQIERKNRRINTLTKERELLLNSSLRQAHKNADMQSLLQKIQKEKKEEIGSTQ